MVMTEALANAWKWIKDICKRITGLIYISFHEIISERCNFKGVKGKLYLDNLGIDILKCI